MPTFDSPHEEFVYNDLTWINQEYQSQGLTASSTTLRSFLTKIEEEAEWDHGLYCEYLEEFKLENGRKNPAYLDGIMQLDGLFDAACSINSSFNPFDYWGDAMNHIREPSVFGQIYRLIDRESDPKGRLLLAGYAHIIQYETRGDLADRRIGMWASAAIADSGHARLSRVAREKKRFFTILRAGCLDANSDMFHLRNAFAHAHFQFQSEDTVLLWDERDGERNYEITLGLGDLFNITSIFRNKLLLCETYPRLWVFEKALRPIGQVGPMQ